MVAGLSRLIFVSGVGMARGETARFAALGHYKVAELLGAGGMGEVYLAHSPSGRAVAMKVIREDLATRPGFRERFAREVQAARQVSGAFTAPVLDADTTGDVPWMATQYVAGPSLADAVDERGPLSADEVWQLASGLCEALRDIHRVGLVHRDFKPGNILLAEDGPRVIDFGISRVVDATALTQSGQLMGTPLFMAPEQFRDPRDAGPPADVFALGSVLVYAATGHGPFDADTPYAIAWNAVHEEPNLSGLPESLRPVVAACLRKDPAERPDPDGLLTLLSSRRERRAQHALAREAALAQTRRKRLRRGVLALSAAACAGLVVVAWLWWPQLKDGEATAPRPSATTTPRPAPASVRLPGWKPWTAQLPQAGETPFEMPTCRFETPALWCTGSGTLMARVDPRTGKVLWRQASTGRSGARTFFSVTPLEVFVGEVVGDGTQNATSTIRNFDTETGKPLKEHRISGVEACDLVAETLFCVQGGKIVAWEPGEMTRMWAAAPGWDLLRSPDGYASDRVHVVKRDAGGRATEVGEITQGDGTLLWRRDVPAGTDLVRVSGDFVYCASPDRRELTGLIRLDRRTGATKSVELGVPEELLGLVGDVFYTHRAGVVSAYDIAAERRLWSAATLQEELSGPTVEGDRVHFTAQDGTVIALDRRTGGALWQHRPPKLNAGTVGAAGPKGLQAPVTLGDVVFAPALQMRIRSFLASAASTTSPTEPASDPGQ